MYAFLSQPPPPKPKKRTVMPSPKASSYAQISTWASRVQPGSPAPCSPPQMVHRRTSNSSCNCSPNPRRLSSASRRPSITYSHSRKLSGSFTIRTPSSAAAAEYPDLTAIGYTSVFIQFDKTPTTPSPYLRHQQQRNVASSPGAVTPLTSDVFGSIPIPVSVLPTMPQSAKPAKRVGIKRFRSLILRPKKAKQPTTLPPSPTKSSKSKHAVAQRKRAKYAAHPSKHVQPPPSLANDLALMQFMEGGSMEDNVRRVMKVRAKAAGTAADSDLVNPVGDVYRDEKGGIWHDADEEMEYAHLLAENSDDISEWEAEEDETQTTVALGPIVKASSPHTNVYCPLDNLHVACSPMTPPSNSIPSRSILSIPSRPRRSNLSTPHFLLDIEAFAPRSPRTPTFKVSPPSPSHKQRHTRLHPRPRPAPLNLTSSESAYARANAKVALVALQAGRPSKRAAPCVSDNDSADAKTVTADGLSPRSLDKARREFVEDSFMPCVVEKEKEKGSSDAGERKPVKSFGLGVFTRKGWDAWLLR